MPTWTFTIFDHRGHTVSRLETASGLILVPGRDRLDVYVAPLGQSRLACVREGSLSIGDLDIEAVRGLRDGLAFAAWSTKDDISIAGAAWPTKQAQRNQLAHLATLLASSRVPATAPGRERLVAAATKLYRLASQ